MLKELLENIRILIRVFVSIMEHSDSRKRKNLKLFKEIQDHISNRKEKTDIFVSQAFQHITGLNLSYSDIFDLLQEDEFNNNCKLCGCKSQTQWSDGGSFASSVWQSKGQIEPGGLGTGDTFTTIRRVAMSMDSQCKSIITESIKYLCGQGASINRSECSQG